MKKITKQDLILSLTSALSYSKPDEYQWKHNLLIRQLAFYITQDKLENSESEKLLKP